MRAVVKGCVLAAAIGLLTRSEGVGAVAADAGWAVGGEGKSGFRFSGKTQPSLLPPALFGLLLFDPALLMAES